MEYEKLTDLAFSADGDFILEDGDLALSKGEHCLADNINVVVKTQKGDSEVFPNLGADLEELTGKSNTHDVANEGADRITGEIISKGIAAPGEVDVVPIPLGKSILYYVFVDGAEKMEYMLNLDTGGISL